MLSSCVAQFLAHMIDHTVAQVCAMFVSSSSPCFMRTLSDSLSLSPTSPSVSLSFSSFPLSSCTSYCLSPSSSLMSWTTTTRTAAEELGHPDYKNSSTVYEPNDHFITEAYVEFIEESVTEQRFPEDYDHDDITIGQTLVNACRRRADHSEGEGLSSCLSSSSSMSHDRTLQPVVCRDTRHAQTDLLGAVHRVHDNWLRLSRYGAAEVVIKSYGRAQTYRNQSTV